jgi:hypothetical protein
MSRVGWIFLAAIASAAPAHAETAYFSQIEDLPMPAGFTETADRTEFSNDEVRIISVSASGRAQAERVRGFYGETLSALGWAISLGSGGENETTYLRGREQLSLSFHQRGDELLLEVLLFSRSPPND